MRGGIYYVYYRGKRIGTAKAVALKIGEKNMSDGPYRTIESITREAEKELNEETTADAKRRIKTKLREIKQAERVLANLQTELHDLQAQIVEENR